MLVGEQIESPSLGLGVIWREIAEDVLAFDLVMRAGAPVIPLHVHPHQEERIAVLSGSVRCLSGEREQLLSVGDRVVTPPGEAHTIEPAGAEGAEVRAELDTARRRRVLPRRSTPRCTKGAPPCLRRERARCRLRHRLTSAIQQSHDGRGLHPTLEPPLASAGSESRGQELQ